MKEGKSTKLKLYIASTNLRNKRKKWNVGILSSLTVTITSNSSLSLPNVTPVRVSHLIFARFAWFPPILELSLPLRQWIFSFSPSPMNPHLAPVRYKSTLFSLVVCESVCFVDDCVSLAVPCSVGDGGADKTHKNFCSSCGEGWWFSCNPSSSSCCYWWYGPNQAFPRLVCSWIQRLHYTPSWSSNTPTKWCSSHHPDTSKQVIKPLVRFEKLECDSSRQGMLWIRIQLHRGYEEGISSKRAESQASDFAVF